MGNRRISKLIPGIAVFAVPLLCQSGSAYADNISGGAIPVGASLSGASVTVSTDGAVNIEVVPTADGSLGVNKNQVTVDTTAGSGYTLYISSANTDASGYAPLYLNGNTSSSSKISSIPTSTASSLSANQWGYAVPSADGAGFASLSQYNSAVGTSTIDETLINNLKWKGISSGYGLAKTSNTAGTDTFPVYFGVRANTSIISGNYQNTIIYTAFVEGNGMVDVTPGEITNSGDRTTITTEYKATGHPVTADDITVTLYNNNISSVVATCTNIQILQDGSSAPLSFSCAITQGSAAKGVNYDVEVKLAREDGNYYTYVGDDSWHFYAPPIIDNMYMQDVGTTGFCAGTPLYKDSNKTYTLIDKRDNKQYLVRKLNDGKCWMVQNLALEGGQTITSSNSNLPSGVSYTIPNGTGYTGKFSSDTAEDMYNGTHKDATANNTSDNTGAYYNWNVATAGYDTAGNISSPGGVSDRSICPKGWRLPTGKGKSTEFRTLYNTGYSSDMTSFNTAFNTSYTGNYSNGSRNGFSTVANWWSSGTYAAPAAYDFEGNTSTNSFDMVHYSRKFGRSVRCIAQ